MADEREEEERSTLELAGPPLMQPPLRVGDPAPWFSTASDVTGDFIFPSLGGRTIILAFLGSFSTPEGAELHSAFFAGAGRMVAFTTAMSLVSYDPADDGKTVPSDVKCTRYFFDSGRRIAKLYGVDDALGPVTFILDERLRIRAVVSTPEPANHVREVFALFDRLPKIAQPMAAVPQAPVLIVPRVFEPELCKALIAGYEKNGGEDSGYMVERDGLTVVDVNHQHKRRSDWVITDDILIKSCQARVRRRLVPEIWRAFQFRATYMERYLVSCYSDHDKGHFSRHRDNTTKGTAHRRFAVSLNLNTEEYEGGDLVFPEFGRSHFRPPTGGACVFSCSLLHEATIVTKGKRYVFVPFLYDAPSAEIRAQNERFLVGVE